MYVGKITLNCRNQIMFVWMKTLRINLIWTRNAADGDYTAKKGYEVAIMEQFDGEKSWWWRGQWESESPLKTILTFWLAINNRLLTWENLRKRGI